MGEGERAVGCLPGHHIPFLLLTILFFSPANSIQVKLYYNKLQGQLNYVIVVGFCLTEYMSRISMSVCRKLREITIKVKQEKELKELAFLDRGKGKMKKPTGW